MPSLIRSMLLVAGLAALALATPVAAETAGRGSSAASTSPSPQSTPPTGVTEFTDEELRSFADASLRVEEIGSRWQPRISDAASEADEEQLREQAMNEMVEAVQRKGLSVDRYNRIALAVQSDPQIAETVQSYRATRP